MSGIAHGFLFISELKYVSGDKKPRVFGTFDLAHDALNYFARNLIHALQVLAVTGPPLVQDEMTLVASDVIHTHCKADAGDRTLL